MRDCLALFVAIGGICVGVLCIIAPFWVGPVCSIPLGMFARYTQDELTGK